MIYQGDMQRVIQIAARVTGVHANLLTGDKKNREISHARFIAMKAVREATGKSYPDIGMAFRRDHTTVVHGVRRASQIIEDHRDAADNFHSIMVMAATSRTNPSYVVSDQIDRSALV